MISEGIERGRRHEMGLSVRLQKQSTIGVLVLINFAKFTGKTPVAKSLVYKVRDSRLANFFKKRLRHRCFSMNLTKFLRAVL